MKAGTTKTFNCAGGIGPRQKEGDNMIYTIAEMKDIHNDQSLSFDKVANEYCVSLYDADTDTHVSRHYPTMDAAYSAFEKISKAIITGCYSFEQRKAFL